MIVVRRIILFLAVVLGLFLLLHAGSYVFRAWNLFFNGQAKFYPDWRVSGFVWSVGSLMRDSLFFVVTILGYKDLKNTPAELQERFQFRRLGRLGWFGVGVIAFEIGYFVYSEATFYSLSSERDYLLTLDHFAEMLTRVWFGAMLLYFRFRVPAS